MTTNRDEKRILAESDMQEFMDLIIPNRVLGHVQRRIIRWWTRQDAKSHQLVLLPRDHMKSALVACRIVWEITRDPTLRVLLISSTSNLATKQLKFIKDILLSDRYRLYWPEMVEKEEAKREKWTEREISVDDPRRKAEAIRDPTIFTAGLTSNIVGMHCDIAVLDDVVVQGNAYMEETREKVKEQYSYLSSVETVNAREWVVGTRYHPKDLYNDLMEMEIESYDERGDKASSEPLFEKIEEQVETAGDGSGQYLWPRQQRGDGKWFGFDQDILARKKAQYLNKIHFRAQYYNDPHDVDSSPFKRDHFQYYEPGFLSRRDGVWMFKGQRLNVVAAVDFAYSTAKKADYSSIVVLGVNGSNDYYILDIDRFKTDSIPEYFSRILKLYEKWGFRKIRAEVSVAQSVIVKDLKENYIRPYGLSLVVEEFRPTRWEGSKQERIRATLEARYDNRQIWHFEGGYCQTLEEELLFTNPAHDDIKDALASCIDFAVAPLNHFRTKQDNINAFQFNSRFGGVI